MDFAKKVEDIGRESLKKKAIKLNRMRGLEKKRIEELFSIKKNRSEMVAIKNK